MSLVGSLGDRHRSIIEPLDLQVDRAAICDGPRRTGALQRAGLRPISGGKSKVPKAGDAMAGEPGRNPNEVNKDMVHGCSYGGL